MSNQKITKSDIEEGFKVLFPEAIKQLEIEEDEEENTFTFELEFIEGVEDLVMPDGIFVGYIDFNEPYIDGFVDGVSFLEFVKENQ